MPKPTLDKAQSTLVFGYFVTIFDVFFEKNSFCEIWIKKNREVKQRGQRLYSRA